MDWEQFFAKVWLLTLLAVVVAGVVYGCWVNPVVRWVVGGAVALIVFAIVTTWAFDTVDWG